MKKQSHAIMAGALLLAAGLGDAASHAGTIYVNDFGTVAQRTVGGSGDWTTQQVDYGTANLVAYDHGWNDISVDLDGDTLHQGLSANGYQTVFWIKKIDVAGMSNIALTAHGFGNAGYGCSFGVALSLDGAAWDYSQDLSAPWSAYPATTATVTASGAAYQNINTVYMRIRWTNTNETLDQPWYTAYITDVTLTGVVPEPASLAMLGLGGMILLRRRR